MSDRNIAANPTVTSTVLPGVVRNTYHLLPMVMAVVGVGVPGAQ